MEHSLKAFDLFCLLPGQQVMFLALPLPPIFQTVTICCGYVIRVVAWPLMPKELLIEHVQLPPPLFSLPPSVVPTVLISGGAQEADASRRWCS